MRAVIRHVELEPEPASLPGDAAGFAFTARQILGPADGPGEESFDVTVCSPEWLAARSTADGFIDGRHKLIVNVDGFSEAGLQQWLERRVSATEGDTWREVAEKLARLGYWEFEDYTA